MKRLAVLGSTGSIGRATLDVVARFPDRFRIEALAAGRNVELLYHQAVQHRPSLVAVEREDDARRLARELPRTTVLAGEEGRMAVAAAPQATSVVGAFVGALGLVPTWNALVLGREILLANKETLVIAGDLVMACAAAHGASILPIDSEHNALHQGLRVGPAGSVKRLILTASGGPFRTWPRQRLAEVTVEQALAHPTWSMGAKISIDSATMMNKGLEIIEAYHLFGVPENRIGVLIHPESRVHSLVEYEDGTLIAQLSVNDMRFPILYALAYPDRLPSPFGTLDLAAVGALHFEPADEERFPCLAMARAALQRGGSAPATLNAANEVAVAAFLRGELPFIGIERVIAATLERDARAFAAITSLGDVLDADARGRAWACEEAVKYPGAEDSL